MGSLPGRIGGKGKKGRSGRKSKYQELADAQREIDLMYTPQEVQDLLEKYKQLQIALRTGKKSTIKMSVREVMYAKELLGNERLISLHYGKVVPDEIRIKSKNEHDFIFNDEQARRIARRILTDSGSGKKESD